ncbi:MAG: DMT family transporter [Cyclobacteriaceae bacterium]|nr:DMT family transporter [Cyclobacteriaceae bacterium]
MTRTRDYLELHFIVLLWGFTAVLGKLITIPPVELVFYRVLLSSVLLAIWLGWKKESFRVQGSTLWQLLGNGVLIAGHWVTFFASARVSNVSISLAGFATIALWTSLLEPLILKRRFRWYEFLLGLVIIAGLYIIFRFQIDHAWGLCLGIISAFLGALFTVFNGKFTRKHHHFTITLYEMIGATLGIALVFPWYALQNPEGLQLTPTSLDWVYILILALVCTVYAYSISVELMKRLSAFAINLTVNLEPVYGIILALIILGDSERMTTDFYIGTLVILGAVLAYPFFDRARPVLSG